ncbi:MAG TPA: sigma-70 family RNA polymerase sigma factor [Miltoncostaeaceae bacterium]|nr:sigma-70 family RNA polymerase sigma factor [Miltoncostaeaceae bacterium]
MTGGQSDGAPARYDGREEDGIGFDLDGASDARLIQLAAAGDGVAFEHLYGRFARPVRGLALRQLRDAGRAEEVVQETFAAVWRSARSFTPDRGRASSWLFAVARNAVLTELGRRRVPVADVAELPDEADDAASPHEDAELAWRAWRVHAALERLPEAERAVLELAYWSDLSQSEIASYLDVPLGTVKTRTRAGLARMAGLLEELRA